MRIFAERNLPMTVYACALALERNPPAGGGDQGRGPRHLLPRLALDRAFQIERGRGSSAENGSSISSASGSTDSARANPTRWRMPPDSSSG